MSFLALVIVVWVVLGLAVAALVWVAPDDDDGER